MTDMFRVDGKVAVIIGGAGGIGQILVLGLAQQGANVAIADLNLPGAEEAVREIQPKVATRIAAFPVDVTDEKSVMRLAKNVVSEFGTVDILVNSQGVNIKKPAVEFPMQDWDKMFDINVKSIMLVCREFGKILIAKKSGKVINISSVRGIRATFWGGNEAYCATKGAVDMITRSLAAEWAPYNINVNAIGPSWIATKFAEETLKDVERLKRGLANVPLGRVGQPQDLMGACIFLASPASDFITGQILYLDGGLTAVG